MKTKSNSVFPLGKILLVIIGVCVGAHAQSPTDGWSQYSDTFKVQPPYNLPDSARFSDTGGMYTCWIYPTDMPLSQGSPTGPRCEMRWTTWTNQKIGHMWDADVMMEPGTNHTCIMQVKSNTAGEAVYMQAGVSGELHQGGGGTSCLTNYAGKWFNMKVAWDPPTATGRVWIDNVLKYTVKHSGSNDWYFKNGTYCNGMTAGTKSMTHYKNIKFWINQPVASVPRLTIVQNAAPREATFTLFGNRLCAFPTAFAGKTKTVSVFDLSGRMLQSATTRANFFELNRIDCPGHGLFVVTVKTENALK